MFGSRIPYPVKFYAFLKLCENIFTRKAVAGMKGGVIAIGAASYACRAVSVGAGETRV